MIILRKFTNINIKQFLKFKIHVFKHSIRKKHLFRRMNKNVFMRQIIDDLTIKTQIFKAIHKKFNHKKTKKFIKKSRQNTFNSKL